MLTAFGGDLGFIHVCYDINEMDAWKKLCFRQKGIPTINSKSKENSVSMGDAPQVIFCL
jgi:hypothetical protein